MVPLFYLWGPDSRVFFAVSCFVLSQEPYPTLSSALRRFHRRQERVDVRLSTIHESASQRPMANLKGYSKRNVILHLTGGGFYAHTIAGDLPYLLDWSSSSKAVVIVPEYSLSPKKYPEAITEVILIYRALRFGQAAVLLGFQSDRIIVSGESVGGNLATAICVSLIMAHEKDQCEELTHQHTAEMGSDLEDTSSYNDDEDPNAGGCGWESKFAGLDIPDALLLSCPALNLSLDSTPSRIYGANDPVLPSALISTISASYLGGCPPTDPIASPYYASDAVLRNFPPTLIFTSSEDPLLDDSVSFNGRLRSVGVLSRLRAVHDLPHAFWGESYDLFAICLVIDDCLCTPSNPVTL
jgi:acetyl esterase/lipase